MGCHFCYFEPKAANWCKRAYFRINISIAIVEMVGTSGNSSKSPCSHNDTSENVDIDNGGEGEDVDANKLGWSGSEVSWVLTSFFIGYAAFQVSQIQYAVSVDIILDGRWKIGRSVWHKESFWNFQRRQDNLIFFNFLLKLNTVGVAVLALLTPILAKQNVWIIFVVRLIQVMALSVQIHQTFIVYHIIGFSG